VYVVSVTPKDFPVEATMSLMEQSIFEEPITPEVVEAKIQGFFGSYVGYFIGLYVMLLLMDKLGVFRERSRILTESAFAHYASITVEGSQFLRESQQFSAADLDLDPSPRDSGLSWHTKDFAAFNAEFYKYLE
jgi:hypothetical protein